MTRALSAALLLLIVSFALAGGLPKPEPAFATELAKAQTAAQAREVKLYTEFGRRLDAAKTETDRIAVQRWAEGEWLADRKTQREAVANLMPLLRRSAADPAAFGGLTYAASKGDDDTCAEAGGLLRRHHLAHPETLALAQGAGYSPDEWGEALLRDLLADRAVPADDRVRLRFALAMHLKLRAGLPDRIAGDPDRMAVRYGKDRVAVFRKADVPKLEAEALKLFDAVAADGGRVERASDLTFADSARSEAHEIRNLGVGKKAAEIAGEDLDGAKLRLSDFKGKVVVLSFWGSACSPCMALVPHEREIVERFKDRPFALVGVCSDADREKVKPALEKHKITWPSFWCGPKGMRGDLPRAWNVTGWPTVYVIDHTGVIRSKTARGPELDRLLGDLVKKAEADTPK